MLFEYSDKSSRLQQQLAAFMERHVYPNEAAYAAQLEAAADRFAPLPLMEELKQKARDEGLWNLFVPESHGEFSAHGGLSNLDYYPLAETMGRVLWSAEVFNCSAPDTGNMEVLMKYATPEQQQQWLEPLLAGEIRSSYAMTEPQVASSDATNIELSMTLEGDEWLLDGRKWFITGAMNQRTRIIIVMGKSDPANPDRHRQQTQVLVPRDAPGVEVVRALTTLGYDDAPIGHAEIHFNQVRVPAENVLLGAGRGFEIAQGRLGPGRIHHCMRAVGMAEKALRLMCERAVSRRAFGKALAKLGGNYDRIAQARMNIDMMRLLTLQTAWVIDRQGVERAQVWISKIKAEVPRTVIAIIDDAIQMHGAAGLSQDFPLAEMYMNARSLRLADGPDEVHRMVVARAELEPYLEGRKQ